MKKKEHNYNIYQKFVEEMVNSDTIITNAGVFEYKGKSYILTADIREINSKPQVSQKEKPDNNDLKKPCPNCDGKGEVKSVTKDLDGYDLENCSDCDGQGFIKS